MLATFFVIWFRREGHGNVWSKDGNQFVTRSDAERHIDECVDTDPELEGVAMPHNEAPMLGKPRKGKRRK